MPTEFDSLSTVSAWSAKLAELLEAARAATEEGDEARLAAARRLTDFVAHSHPASPDIQRLDQVAAFAARALAERIAHDAVDRIASRTAMLDSCSAELRAIRDHVNKAAPAAIASIADLSERLSIVASDAAALVNSGPADLEDSGGVQSRIDRLVNSLFELHAAFRIFSSLRSEPSRDGSGTVIPEVSRASP